MSNGYAAQVLGGHSSLSGQGQQAADFSLREGGFFGVVGVDETNPLRTNDERNEDGAGRMENFRIKIAHHFIQARVGGNIFYQQSLV